MNACSTKMETVREILRLSPHADERFLFDFDEQELAAYLEQLRRLARALGSEQLMQPIPCEC